jgi:hypothetical protein
MVDKKTMMIIGAVLILAIFTVVVYSVVEPFTYRSELARACDLPTKTQGYGLNTQGGKGNGYFTVCDFIEMYKDKLIMPETDPYDVIPRQYCAVMYERMHEDFSDQWESLGLCEKDVKEQLAMQKCKNF